MKIIDNKKDIYDYLEKYYALNDSIVYDRKDSIILSSELKDTILSSKKEPCETLNDTAYLCVLAAGMRTHKSVLVRHFNANTKKIEIVIKEYLNNLGTYNKGGRTDYAISSEIVDGVLKSVSKKAPLILGLYKLGDSDWFPLKSLKIFENPILKDTPFKAIATPQNIMEGISEYLKLKGEQC